MVVPTQQSVLLLRKFGGPDGFAVVERPVPEPDAGEVLVKVLAASVQFTDVMLRKGQYPDLKEKPPLVLGYDLVGEVAKVGHGVTSLSVGQRVADLTMT
jgi:NADPH:quinone reductase-like Zn-dependent oxidoreductase